MVDSKLSEHCLLLNVGVVARGHNCISIMKELATVKPSRLRLRVVAIAAIPNSAACNKFAGEMGIEVFDNYLDLLNLEFLDVILEFTGDNRILTDIINQKPPTVGLLDQKSSMMLFDINQLYDNIENKDTEVTLANSFASTLLEASPDGVLVVDREYRIINSNYSPLVTGGLDRNAILNKYCYEVINRTLTPCLNKEFLCPINEALKTGKPSRRVLDITLPDGSVKVCQETTYPIVNRFNETVQFVITIRDMTQELSQKVVERTEEIKKNLARVVKEERLASLGRLVASVCHEINNPITSIVTFTKLVAAFMKEEKDKDIPEEINRYLELSFREALRCGRIVKNLLTFARQNNLDAARIDLTEMINTILVLTGHQLQLANVVCKLNLPRDSFNAWGDYGQIQQCLMNLILNAIDAMPNGGELTITGGEDKSADAIWIEVVDTGHGIDPENQQKIFEPFFTTKTNGKGVGLGLAMVYGIIYEHQGSIEVDSIKGKETRFRIKLPKTAPDQRKETSA